MNIYVLIYFMISTWILLRCDDPYIKATPGQRNLARVIAFFFGPIILLAVMFKLW